MATRSRSSASAQNAIGRRVTPPEELKSTALQVVGVFANGRRTPGVEEHALYTSIMQHPPGRAMTLVVKAASAGDLHSVDMAVRASIQKIGPVMPIAEVRKGEDHAAPELAQFGSPRKLPCCSDSWR